MSHCQTCDIQTRNDICIVCHTRDEANALQDHAEHVQSLYQDARNPTLTAQHRRALVAAEEALLEKARNLHWVSARLKQIHGEQE